MFNDKSFFLVYMLVILIHYVLCVVFKNQLRKKT